MQSNASKNGLAIEMFYASNVLIDIQTHSTLAVVIDEMNQ